MAKDGRHPTMIAGRGENRLALLSTFTMFGIKGSDILEQVHTN